MMNSILYTENLNVGYGEKTVVESVDINALRGNMICILGPNGSGKSTILRTLSGMLAPVKGTVYIENIDINKSKKSILAKMMSVVLTERLKPGLMTAYQIVSMGRHPYTGFFGRLKEKDHEIIKNSLQIVNAKELSYRFFNELSDGEKQKIMIARALAQEPELIILDEPTSHLDIRHKVEVIKILAKLCAEKNITVIMALHDIDLAIKGCEHIIMVKDGKILASGMPEEIVSGNMIEKLYDISNARYNDLLGNLELDGTKESQVFVIAGSGTGIPIFRGLRRLNYGFDSGILYKSDVDYHVSKAMANEIITERDYEKISPNSYKKALDLIMKKEIIIDTGFPIGSMNEANEKLIETSLDLGKTVYSLRKTPLQFKASNNQLVYFENLNELYLKLKEKIND